MTKVCVRLLDRIVKVRLICNRLLEWIVKVKLVYDELLKKVIEVCDRVRAQAQQE